MGGCGCCEFTPRAMLPGPNGSVYTFDIYHPCENCESGLAVDIYLVTPQGQGMWDVTGLPQLALHKIDIGLHLATIPILDVPRFKALLTGWVQSDGEYVDLVLEDFFREEFSKAIGKIPVEAFVPQELLNFDVPGLVGRGWTEDELIEELRDNPAMLAKIGPDSPEGKQIRHDLASKAGIIDPELDKPVQLLCAALNSIPTIRTTSSCSGHGDEPMRIWFEVGEGDPKWLFILGRCIDKRYSPSDFTCEVSISDLPESPLGYMLTSKHVTAGAQADFLAGGIIGLLHNRTVLDHFNLILPDDWDVFFRRSDVEGTQEVESEQPETGNVEYVLGDAPNQGPDPETTVSPDLELGPDPERGPFG